MKSCWVMMFVPVPFTPTSRIVLAPMVTSVSAPSIRDRDVGGEVGGGDPEIPQVHEVLAAHRIGVEISDRVVAEAGGEHEDVVAGAAIQSVVAGAADEDVGAGSAGESIPLLPISVSLAPSPKTMTWWPWPPMIFTMAEALPVPVKVPAPVK